MPESFKQFGGIGKNGVDRNLSSRNLGSTHVARMNKLYANNLCIDQNVDISGNVVIEGTLDVSGHAQFCDVSACNVDISGNLRAGLDQITHHITQVYLGGGVIKNPRIYVGKDEVTLTICDDIIVGSDLRYTKDFDTCGNCIFGNLIQHNPGATAQNNITTGNIMIGSLSGRVSSGPIPTTLTNGVFLGLRAVSEQLNESDNEIVIGAGSVGKGSNTAQIGNSDVSAVYLGTEGSDCTLYVDNSDISGNLRAGFQQFAALAPFGQLRGAGEILNPRIYVDIDDESKSDVIVGSGGFFAFTNVDDSSHNCVFGNFIRHNKAEYNHITS